MYLIRYSGKPSAKPAEADKDLWDQGHQLHSSMCQADDLEQKLAKELPPPEPLPPPIPSAAHLPAGKSIIKLLAIASVM